jgi:hypothetical protein
MPNPTAAHWMQQPRCVGGHFAGIQFFDDNIDTPRMAVEMEYPKPPSTLTKDAPPIRSDGGEDKRRSVNLPKPSLSAPQSGLLHAG